MHKAQHYGFNNKQELILTNRLVWNLPTIKPIIAECGCLKHPLASDKKLCRVLTYEYVCPIIPFLIEIILKILEDGTSRENRERCVQYGLLIPLDN